MLQSWATEGKNGGHFSRKLYIHIHECTSSGCFRLWPAQQSIVFLCAARGLRCGQSCMWYVHVTRHQVPFVHVYMHPPPGVSHTLSITHFFTVHLNSRRGGGFIYPQRAAVWTQAVVTDKAVAFVDTISTAHGVQHCSHVLLVLRTYQACA